MAFHVAEKCLIILICISFFISCFTAESPETLILKHNSSNCSVAVEANGCVAQIEVVRNSSMTMLLISNTFGFVKSLFLDKCNTTFLGIQLLNSNASIHLNQNGVHLEAIKLSSSMIKFQNGTMIAGVSVLVPQLSVIELEHAIFTSTLNSQQFFLTIQGTLLFINSDVG
jgi:hypothetical protein